MHSQMKPISTSLLHHRLLSNKSHQKMIIFAVILTWWTAHGQQHFDKVVAQDGTGDYLTISEAIDAAPSHSLQKYYIKVKAGTYSETIKLGPEKTNIALVGEGMNDTILTGDKNAADGLTTPETATIGIFGKGFVAKDLTFENTAGPHKGQAVALLIEADESAFFRCRFLGYQDTLYTKSGSQFFRECEIYGTVDFIFGRAAAVFQSCGVYARMPLPGQSNTITANQRMSTTGNGGIVLQKCKITAAPDLERQGKGVRTYLGRPWDSYSKTVIMESLLDKLIDPRGWLAWAGRELSTVYYAEYANHGPGAATGGRVGWSRNISSPTEAKMFTVRNFIRGQEWIPSTGIPFSLDLDIGGF